MLSGIVEALRQRCRLTTLPAVFGAVTPAFGTDAPKAEATNVVTRATIAPTVKGAVRAGRQDWANSIAMH
jgi:putative hemolysin